MERHQVQAFIAVLDQGGFSAAADALGISQPSVSQAVAALERSLGFPLFQRLHRGTRLTAAGSQLVEPARALLHDFAVLGSIASQVQGVTAGRLDLIAIPTLTHELAELVGRFRVRHPDVLVHCGDPGLEAVEDLVRSGVCDLGLGEMPSDAQRLVVVPIGSQPFLLVQPPGSEPRATISRSALAALDYVATPRGTSSRALLDDALSGRSARVRVETAQREALVPLVIAGAGSALLPESLALQAAAQGAQLVVPEPALERTFALMHRPGPIAPAASAFLALVTASTTTGAPDQAAAGVAGGVRH